MMNEKNNMKPTLLIFAGPNGSGKSTVTKLFKRYGEYSNADDIVLATGMSNLKAAQIVDSRRYELIEEHKDFTFETVLSSKRKMELIKQAKDAGYFIKCVFVLTNNPNINIERVQSRVDKGGHDVPEDKIISRYYKSLKQIPELLSLCDIMHIYDNTKAVTRIVRKHKEQFSVYPNQYWPDSEVLKLIHGEIDAIEPTAQQTQNIDFFTD